VSEQVDVRSIPAEDREEMAHELSRVRVVVSLSEFETQPIALLEAAALGCRLVVAETPGLGALAQEGLARPIPAKSTPAQVASIILEELDQPAPAGQARLRTWDDCADALHELYSCVSRCHLGAEL
jgi:glycosyltransferase involved in cell wall biosynthesis